MIPFFTSLGYIENSIEPIEFKTFNYTSVQGDSYLSGARPLFFPDGSIKFIVNLAGDHFSDGILYWLNYDKNLKLITGATEIPFTDTYKLNLGSARIIGNNVYLFVARYNSATGDYVDNKVYVSNDGLIGLDYDEVAINPNVYLSYNYFDKTHLIGNEYVNTFFGHNNNVEWEQTIRRFNSSGVLTSQNTVVDSLDKFGEMTISVIDQNNWIGLVRNNNDGGAGISQFNSIDAGITWTNEGVTNLIDPTHIGHASMMLASDGLLYAVIMDRQGAQYLLTKGNDPTTVLSNSSGWNTPVKIWDSSVPGFAYGYPSIDEIRDEEFLITLGDETELPLNTASQLVYGQGSLINI